ncbi:MAG: hypothetical protein ACRBK7_00800 [Acidimicrobiales bacterium]
MQSRRGAGFRLPTALFLLVTVLATGCSGTLEFGGFGNSSDDAFRLAGEELIEGELADQIGLGPLEAECTGSDLSAGDTFDCTAAPGGLDPIQFIATINGEEDGLNIVSTNLLLASQVDEVEAFAASLIENRTSTAIGAENFDCADSSLVISPGEVIECRVTDPADGVVYEAPVTIDDLADLSVTVSVGDPIG